MTEPEQPEGQQPDLTPLDLSKPLAQTEPAQAEPTVHAQPAPESFSANVERLVAEGKLTAAEAAELLEPQAPAATEWAAPGASGAPDGMPLQLVLPGEAGTPPDLRLEVAGYSLQVVLDASLAQPRLSANRDGVLELRAGRNGWSVEALEHHRLWGLKAVLSLPFTPRDVQAEVSGGNLTLSAASGQVRIEVSGGNVTLGESGHLRAEVSGGNLTAGEVSGELRLEVNGGNMTVARSSALMAEINGGQLTWTGVLSSGDHDLEVNGGQAILHLEHGSSVTVRAESTLGGVSASFPLQKSGGMMHASYAGALGGGEARLKCKVNAGQIRLVAEERGAVTS
ncbi:hypothetical protein [Deinococcus altitudinis]|uniref:hypothetical protein n=1 Tax=Deinococcus altitudinis TaxID=468914 RepID=UPI0038924B3D